VKSVNRFSGRLLVTLLAALPFVACGGDDEPEEGSLGPGATCDPEADVANAGCVDTAECVQLEGATNYQCRTKAGQACDPEAPYCTTDMTCAEVENGEYRCFGRITLHGDVTDTSSAAPIEGAHVLAVDEEGVAVTDVAQTDAMGNYDLEVPVKRAEDGTPLSTNFTLKAAAQDYQPFPSGVRVALPIDVSEAEASGATYVVENALTSIGLIPLEEGDRTTITGSIVALEGAAVGNIGGVLVVATSGDASLSGISDRSGDFTIFNVPEGDYEVQGYAADIQLETAAVSVAAEPVVDVTLNQIGDSTTTVTGNVQIVNAAGGSLTSIILVVEDTFDSTAARGEAPRGLRSPPTGAPDVSGDFTITGVPAGRYVVLAAYENDDLVRDPDTNIGGTDIVSLEVAAGDTDIALDSSFKVTQALETISPGAEDPEAVSEKPELVWVDDSSEEWYDVRVFDAFGDEVWTSLMLPSVSGGDDASVMYEGPLEPGMYYQFRVTSWRQSGGDAAPISATEDLRGVFFLPAE
jgi:hypothetical protein